MTGDTSFWNPRAYLREWYPEVRVIEMDLPGTIQGCVDHKRRIIWLSPGLDEVQQRSALSFEIGQLVLGPVPANPCLAAMHQRAAADWAAQMLIPAQSLFDAFAVSNDYAAMAAHLNVDLPTLRARFRSLTDAEQDGVLSAVRGWLDPVV